LAFTFRALLLLHNFLLDLKLLLEYIQTGLQSVGVAVAAVFS
jgi:hypothetical protein